jgi:AcrR family transcriptional regulator
MDDAAARSAVLSAADRVFYAHGVAGTSMVEIREAAGVSLRRLYALYPSKELLAEAWLRERHGTWMAWFKGAVERHSKSGVQPLLAAFDAIDEWASTPGYRGCAFINTAAETTGVGDMHRVVIAEHKRELISYLTSLVPRQAGRRRSEVGEAIGVLLDGAIVQSALLSSRRPIAVARRTAEQLLGGHR